MQIVYPYNEILPKRKAHDVYLFHNCLSLSQLDCEVSLLIGGGSESDDYLFNHYHSETSPHMSIHRLPIVRKNNFLSLSWNFPFFFYSQRFIKRVVPDVVICSVLKQAKYHFSRKFPNTKYVYELHELKWYPSLNKKANAPDVLEEKKILEKADLIVVTTEALAKILQSPPYALKVPIEVIPLAVKVDSLPSLDLSIEKEMINLMYIGQLYQGQGVDLLLKALKLVKGVKLDVVGGSLEDIAYLQDLAAKLNVVHKVKFHGFCPPATLSSYAKKADAFVAPFDESGRMPYVAHTKLLEYSSWGRPVIAPDLSVVHEHFSEGKGLIPFDVGDKHSLAAGIAKLTVKKERARLQKEIEEVKGVFSWGARAVHYSEVLRGVFA